MPFLLKKYKTWKWSLLLPSTHSHPFYLIIQPANRLSSWVCGKCVYFELRIQWHLWESHTDGPTHHQQNQIKNSQYLCNFSHIIQSSILPFRKKLCLIVFIKRGNDGKRKYALFFWKELTDPCLESFPAGWFCLEFHCNPP